MIVREAVMYVGLKTQGESAAVCCSRSGVNSRHSSTGKLLLQHVCVGGGGMGAVNTVLQCPTAPCIPAAICIATCTLVDGGGRCCGGAGAARPR